jgi:hypothetical protein
MSERNHGFNAPTGRGARGGWVLLAYRIPREPSTPRIALWRKLRQLGAAQIVDGLVALPSEPRTREQFGWLAEQIHEAAGEASVWEASLPNRRDERALIAAMSAEVSAEYAAIAAQAGKSARASAPLRARALARLRRELHRIEARDYFAVSEKQAALAALEKLSAKFEETKR